jgi:hypothetical protein
LNKSLEAECNGTGNAAKMPTHGEPVGRNFPCHWTALRNYYLLVRSWGSRAKT